jgi:hypothetical protein
VSQVLLQKLPLSLFVDVKNEYETTCNETLYVPDQRVQGLNSFPIHPMVFQSDDVRIASASTVVWKQAETVREEAFVAPLDQGYEPTKGVGTGCFVIVVEIRRIRQEIVGFSLQLLEGGRDRKPRFVRHAFVVVCMFGRLTHFLLSMSLILPLLRLSMIDVLFVVLPHPSANNHSSGVFFFYAKSHERDGCFC